MPGFSTGSDNTVPPSIKRPFFLHINAVINWSSNILSSMDDEALSKLPPESLLQEVIQAASTGDQKVLVDGDIAFGVFALGHFEEFDRSEYSSADIANLLHESLPPERVKELRSGKPFLDEEWRQFIDHRFRDHIDWGEGVCALWSLHLEESGSCYGVSTIGGEICNYDGPWDSDEDIVEHYSNKPDTASVDEEDFWGCKAIPRSLQSEAEDDLWGADESDDSED
jgi:hypothetical protein